jgi:signal transduction histidine kinase
VPMPELAQVGAGWPLAASLAAAVTARGLRSGRRRMALNEALHELRRPLQALALAAPGPRPPRAPGAEWSLQMAAIALDRLEREINGEPAAARREPVRAEPLLGAAVGRWKARAALAGGALELRWRAGDAVLEGDRCGIAQALDNLIVNAIDHGGPEIAVDARICRGRLCLSVIDSGRVSLPTSRRQGPAELMARLSGRRRHGHGLRVVAKTAAAHGGEFRLRRCGQGAEAMLELPLIGAPGEGR